MSIQNSRVGIDAAIKERVEQKMSKAIRSVFLKKHIAFAVSRDCQSKALATAPTSKPYPCSPPLSLLHTQAHEKTAMRTAREPMRTAAERKDCPKGWAWRIYELHLD